MRTCGLLLGVCLPLVLSQHYLHEDQGSQHTQNLGQQQAFPHPQSGPPQPLPPGGAQGSQQGVQQPGVGGQTEVSRASNLFANELYKQLSQGSGNVLVCPLSLHVALALVQTGAGSNTKAQLTSALGFRQGQDVKRLYKTTLDAILNDQNVLKVATKMFPAKGNQLYEKFQNDARTHFYSDIENVDYNLPVEAAKKINDYVEKKTNNKITNLISPDSLNSLTRLIIVNAVHFQSNWKKPFPTSFDEDFLVNSQEKVRTRMMGQTDYFLYKEDPALNAKVLQMDYDKGGFSMLIVLPNNADELKNVEGALSKMTVADLTSGLRENKVEVIIPKFRLEQTLDLKDTLMKMNITEMFSSRADLKGIVKGDNVYVSSVVQKTFIDVHENGTEAAAATVVLETLSANTDVRIFFARTPFIFYLVHGNKSIVLFEGRFQRPSGEAVTRNEEMQSNIFKPRPNKKTPESVFVYPNSTDENPSRRPPEAFRTSTPQPHEVAEPMTNPGANVEQPTSRDKVTDEALNFPIDEASHGHNKADTSTRPSVENHHVQPNHKHHVPSHLNSSVSHPPKSPINTNHGENQHILSSSNSGTYSSNSSSNTSNRDNPQIPLTSDQSGITPPNSHINTNNKENPNDLSTTGNFDSLPSNSASINTNQNKKDQTGSILNRDGGVPTHSPTNNSRKNQQRPSTTDHSGSQFLNSHPSQNNPEPIRENVQFGYRGAPSNSNSRPHNQWTTPRNPPPNSWSYSPSYPNDQPFYNEYSDRYDLYSSNQQQHHYDPPTWSSGYVHNKKSQEQRKSPTPYQNHGQQRNL